MKSLINILRQAFYFGPLKEPEEPPPKMLPPLKYPKLIGVDSADPTTFADAICFTLVGTPQKVITCNPSSFPAAGTMAMFGWRSCGNHVDPDIGVVPAEVAISIREYLQTIHPGIWTRAVERAFALSNPDVFIVFGIDDEIVDWIRERGGIIIGDDTASFPCDAVVVDPLDLQTLANTLEQLS